MNKFKYLFPLLGVVTFFSVALPAQASSFTSAQVSAIVSLLQSFEADQTMVASVQTALIRPTSTTPPSLAACVDISRNLTLGITGNDVINLQKFLLDQGYFNYTGSMGYYGPITASAVGKLQAALGLLTTANSPGYGTTGPLTRAANACDYADVVQPSSIIPTPVTTTFTVCPAYSSSVGCVGNGGSLTVPYNAFIGVSWSVANVKAGGCSYTGPDGVMLKGVGVTNATPGWGGYITAPRTIKLSCVDSNGATQSASVMVKIIPGKASATIDASALTSTLTHPKITGTATNVKTIGLSISRGGDKFDGTGNFSVLSDGSWTVTLNNQTYTPGTYGIQVYDGSNNLLTAGTLTVLGTTTLSATPTSGKAPLAVKFTATPGGNLYGSLYSIDFGDGTSGSLKFPVCLTTGSTCSATATHTYTKAGTYKSTLRKVIGVKEVFTGDTNIYETIGTATVTVNPVVTTTCGTLASGATLTVGQSRTSCNGSYKLILQGDGNLVLYKVSTLNALTAVWSTKTSGKTVGKLAMQVSSNLVLYNASSTAVWASSWNGGKTGQPGFLKVQDNGTLTIYSIADNAVLWSLISANL